MSIILITGGTGLVGRRLCGKLQERGYNVSVLGRTQQDGNDIKAYLWDPAEKIIAEEAVEDADYIIHLAGANIGEKRWTPKRKQIILDSRVQTAQLILDTIKKSNHQPKAFISASAVGYYGAVTSGRICKEADPPHPGFLGAVCRQWEREADSFGELGIRTVKIRSGVVLSERGGALAKMILPVKLGIGSALGTGNQYLPWIHIDDLCGIYLKAIEDEKMSGPYNAVAPEHITNKVFARTLARVLRKPFWFPAVPSLAMKILFGEMSEMLLKGSRVSPDKIMAVGYAFRFPGLEGALRDLVGK